MDILEVFEYNQHFVAMMNIINKARLNPPISGHKHHIIPRCWFKHNNIEVNNSEANLVLLTYEEHKLVHKFAVLCGKELWFINKMKCASNYHFGISPWKGCSATVETRNKISESKKGKKLNITNEDRERRTNQMKELNKNKDYFGCSNSFFGKQHTNESKELMSKLKKGKHWRIVNGKREWYDWFKKCKIIRR